MTAVAGAILLGTVLGVVLRWIDDDPAVVLMLLALAACLVGFGFALGWGQGARRCAERPTVERPAAGRVGPSGVARRMLNPPP